MQINHLKYILKVAELGSITKAANELYISQPSLTKAISNIERKYKIKIFERTATGVTVTLQGKYFLHYAKNVVQTATSLEEVFQNHSYDNQSKLLIAAQEFDFIPKIFLNMYNKYRDNELEFELYQSHRSNIIKAIQKGYCNIGLLVQTNKEAKPFDWHLSSTNLEMKFLDSCGVYVLLGPKSKFYNATSLTFKDLEGQSNIYLDIDDITKAEWAINAHQFHVNTNSVVYCNSISLCIEFLENTDIILYASKWILKYFEHTNIKTFPIIEDNTFITNLIYIKRKNELLTPIEMNFIDEVKKYLNR